VLGAASRDTYRSRRTRAVEQMEAARCSQCGKDIAARAKANVWAERRVVCTPCLHRLRSAASRVANLLAMAGRACAPWTVCDDSRQHGPYRTEDLIALLRGGQVGWGCQVWREGMAKRSPVARLFTAAELADGRLELRDFGQGDGTYRPPLAAEGRVAVGTALSGGPPHRSVRAALPHTALTEGVWRRSARWDKGAGSWAWGSADRSKV
jgi:ribosomal protein L37AE/L43A